MSSSRLPTLKDRDLDSLLPHNWKPADKTEAPTVPAATAERVKKYFGDPKVAYAAS